MKRVLALTLAILLLAVMASPAFADTETINVNMQVTPSESLTGAATATYTNLNDVSWTFNGNLGGSPVSATGKWSGTFDGTNYVGSITAINSYSGPGSVSFLGKTRGLPPQVPIPFGVSKGSINLVVNFKTLGNVFVPLAIQGFDAPPKPFQGNRVLSVTNVAGFLPVAGLPRTGEAPAALNALALLALALGGGALVASRLILARSRVARCAS